jgi:hypothetical protein
MPDPSLTYTTTTELRRLEAEPLTTKASDEPFACDTPKAQFGRKCTAKARYSDFRGGVFASMIVTTVVLSLSGILAIVAATTWRARDSIATAFTGSSTTAARWTRGLHLLINLLSNVLPGASNH